MKLHYTIVFIEVIAQIVLHRQNKNFQNYTNYSLNFSVGNVGITRLLIKNGAHITVFNSAGDSLLHHAARFGNYFNVFSSKNLSNTKSELSSTQVEWNLPKFFLKKVPM